MNYWLAAKFKLNDINYKISIAVRNEQKAQHDDDVCICNKCILHICWKTVCRTNDFSCFHLNSFFFNVNVVQQCCRSVNISVACSG